MPCWETGLDVGPDKLLKLEESVGVGVKFVAVGMVVVVSRSSVPEDSIEGIVTSSPSVLVTVCCTICVMVARSSVVHKPNPSHPSGV